MALRPVLIVIGAGMLAGLCSFWSMSVTAGPVNEPVAHPLKATEPDTFKTRILPFLDKYCLSCHNEDKASAGLVLSGYTSEAHARKNRKDWAAAQHVLAAGEMPPKKKPQPSKEDKEFFINWVENTLTRVNCDPSTVKDPGRVTIRRLNRSEYNNTIRDLCGVDFKPAEDFPADDVGYGFDNIGDVLSFQPILLEKYMAAADKVLAEALNTPELIASFKSPFRPSNPSLRAIPRSAKREDLKPKQMLFRSEGSAFLEKFNFPVEADYVIRFRGWGTKIGEEYPQAVIRIDGKDVKAFTVEAAQDKPQIYEVRAKFPAGDKRIAVAFTNSFEDKEKKQAREFGLDMLEVEGPINPVTPPDSPSVALLLVSRPGATTQANAAAEKVLTEFARRAFRRPVKSDEVARLMKLFELATKQGEPFEKAIRLPMKAVLVSPHFLYRVEADPKNPDDIRTIDDFEFATRLSYFLWSSMPDEELFRIAQKGELRKPAILEAQVKRMLKDPKAKGLSENFAGQWLQLRNLRTIAPDKGYYPEWDEALRTAMEREAVAYFEHIVQSDRSVLEFLDSDYAFVNARLARHYGIPNVSGIEFRQVKLPDNRRGGIVTLASTLTVTSNPTRTSPVKRGKWILENVLGTPPPPPAPDVPELPPTGELKGTLRQQMEQHRANPSCATCHAKLDPLGFGLENFDGIGGWRTEDNKQAIDSSGVLPGGEKFAGPAELRKVLLTKSELFRRCLAEKLLTFSLGRGLEYYDRCALDDIVSAGKAGEDRFSAYVLGIVKSDPFQKRKGKRSE